MYICDETQKDLCFNDAIEQYLANQEDKKAENLAKTNPFLAAQKVYKVIILGIGPKWALCCDEWRDGWNALVQKVCKKYGLKKQTDINPELLAEANIWMIDQMKDMLN